MKQLHSYLYLFAVLSQDIFASTFSKGESASLSTYKVALLKSRKSYAKAKPVARKVF